MARHRLLTFLGSDRSSLLTSLVSYYPLSSTADAAASNTLTNTNAVTFAGGQIGNAAVFDRALSQKLTATLTGLSANTAGSFDFWWKRNGNTSGGAEGIVEIGDPAVNSFIVWTGSNNAQNKIGVYQFVGSALQAPAIIADSLALTDATWYHFALTWASGANNLKLYRDGVVVGTGTMSAVTLGTGLAIGFGAVLSQYVKGSVDEVGVWNKALSAAEVARRAAGGFYPNF